MKRKLNWIDYSIIVIFLAILVVLGTKVKNIMSYKSSDSNLLDNKKEITLKIEGVRQFSVDAVAVGDKVYADETNAVFGEIKDKIVEESYKTLVKTNGEIVSVRDPEKYDITLIVESNILERNTGYFAEGITEVKINSVAKYKTIELGFSGKTIAIEE